jgi:beta-glucanase (GH16 family)
LNLTDISGYAFGLPAGVGVQTIYIDQAEIYGDLSTSPKVVRVGFSAYAYAADEGRQAAIRVVLNTTHTAPVSVTYTITENTATVGIDYNGDSIISGSLTFNPGTTVQTITLQTFGDSRAEADETVDIALSTPSNATPGWKSEAPLIIQDDDIPDPALIDDFEDGVPVPLKPSNGVTVTTISVASGSPLAVPGQYHQNSILSVIYSLPTLSGGFTRTLEVSQDWSDYDGFSFWYYGANTGKTMTAQILDNGVPDPGPTGWELAWSDEFEGPASTQANSANWTYETGGHGWGNQEWQYYTDSTANAGLDGSGHLVITATTENTATTSYTCAHTPPDHLPGPCAYTSARLISMDKVEFAYGRVEAGIQLPYGQGIWPAFWMLGENFDQVGWPNSGEIDIMEYLGHDPTTTYGTVHGPGYSGGSGIGHPHTQTQAFSETYHVFAIEWEPDAIRWYVDSTNFFTLTRSDIPTGSEWVFDHPFFLIMNVAVGGYWPGYPDATTQFPQTMHIDYVRIYQAPDTAERFEATFVDSSIG